MECLPLYKRFSNVKWIFRTKNGLWFVRLRLLHNISQDGRIRCEVVSGIPFRGYSTGHLKCFCWTHKKLITFYSDMYHIREGLQGECVNEKADYKVKF